MPDVRARARTLTSRLRPVAGDVRHAVRGEACLGCRLAAAVQGLPVRRVRRRDLWHHLAAHGQERVRIGLLGGSEEQVSAWREVAPQHQVVLVRPDTRRRRGEQDLRTQLAVEDPFDVVVDLGEHTMSSARLLAEAFWSLRPQGTYLADARAADRRPEEGPTLRADLEALVVHRRDRRGEEIKRNRGNDETDRLLLARALGPMTLGRHHLRVTKLRRSYAKLDEPTADLWLAAAPESRGRVVRRLEDAPVPDRAVLRENDSFRAGAVERTRRSPTPTLREYVRPTCLPGQVAVGRGVLLPDTYRHVTRPRLLNRHVIDLARHWGRPTAPLDGAVAMDGTYYYLDSEFRGHFGHALTEQVARLWGWRETLEHHPDARALMAVNGRRDTLAAFERELFAAAGIPLERIDLVRGPVVPERLLAATPLFANPRFIHPHLLDQWQGLGRNLAAAAPEGPRPRRIFCSRREVHESEGAFGGQRRVCRNGAEVEQWFADRGFEVVFTEDHPLSAQAAMFREAEVVAGYAGSAMFNLIFCSGPTRVVLISSENYTAQNEYLISSAMGHRIDIAWSPAELPHSQGFSSAAFNSAFHVDFARDGDFLERAVA